MKMKKNYVIKGMTYKMQDRKSLCGWLDGCPICNNSDEKRARVYGNDSCVGCFATSLGRRKTYTQAEAAKLFEQAEKESDNE